MKDLEYLNTRIDEIYQLTAPEFHKDDATVAEKLWSIESTVSGLEMACQDWQDIARFISKKFNIDWMELVNEYEQSNKDARNV